MIVIERTVDLSTPVQTETLRGSEFRGEANAHTFKVNVTQDGVPVALTGAVTGRILLANGDGLTIGGSVEGGAAVVTLPQAAYGVTGRFALAIMHTVAAQQENDTQTTCIYACVGSVVNTYGENQYDPGDLIPDAETLQGYIDRCIAAAEAAEQAAQDANSPVSYAAQTLTDAQKMQARTNIGAGAEDMLTGINGLVGYGANAQEQTASAGVTVRTRPNYIALNGTHTGASARRWRLYSTLYGKNGPQTDSDSVASGATLTGGHTYEFRAKIVRGSASATSGLTFQMFKVGASTNLFTSIPRIETNAEKTFRFTLAEDTEISLWAVYSSGATFTNLEMVYWIEDVTNGIRRLPPPVEDGTYTLKATVTNGVPTYSWVAEGASLQSFAPLSMTLNSGGDNDPGEEES